MSRSEVEILPAIPEYKGSDPQAKQVFQSLKSLLDTLTGNRPNVNERNRLVTVNDLWTAGVVDMYDSDGKLVSYEDTDNTSRLIGAKPEGQGVVGKPTKPTHLAAYQAFTSIIIEWDPADYNGHLWTEIWRSETDDIGNSQLVGTSRTLIFEDPVGLTNETRYYWARHVNILKVPGDYNTAAANGTSATTAQVEDGDIGTVSGSKIVASSLSVMSANMGELTAGKIESPDGTMKIDLTDKEIMISGPLGPESDDYVVMTNGKLEFYKYIAGQSILYKAVKHRESGIADNGDTVAIPGYFDTQPDILVSARQLKIYDSASSAQDQTLKMQAENIYEYATGQWQFTAKAELLLGSATGTITVGDSSGQIASNTFTNLAKQTTPNNTTDITVHVQFSSKRGTGVTPNFYYRQVLWRIRYRAVGSGTWLYTSYQTKVIGETFGLVSDIRSLTGLTANDYEFYVEFVAEDVDGSTFTSGGTTYEYAYPEQSSAGEVTAEVYKDTGSGTETDSVNLSLGSYSPPAGWTVTNVDYSYKYSYYQSNVFQDGRNNYYSGPGSLLNQWYPPGENGDINLATFTTKSYSSGSYSANMSFSAVVSQVTQGQIKYCKIKVKDGTAIITIRRPTPNSTTPDNLFQLDSWDYELSTATQLAQGSLNWVALGE